MGNAFLIFFGACAVLQGDVFSQQFLGAPGQFAQTFGDQLHDRQRRLWSSLGFFYPFINFVGEGHGGIPWKRQVYFSNSQYENSANCITVNVTMGSNVASGKMLLSDRRRSLSKEQHEEPEKHVSTSSTTECELLEVVRPRYLK